MANGSILRFYTDATPLELCRYLHTFNAEPWRGHGAGTLFVQAVSWDTSRGIIELDPTRRNALWIRTSGGKQKVEAYNALDLNQLLITEAVPEDVPRPAMPFLDPPQAEKWWKADGPPPAWEPD